MENLEEYYNVRIECENETGKKYVREIECNFLDDVSRLLKLFKPKNGYKITRVIIDERVKFIYG